MPDTRATAEEAEQFLELKRKIDADMQDVFEIAADAEMPQDEFEDTYGASYGVVYTWCVRNKYDKFIEHVYSDGDDTE